VARSLAPADTSRARARSSAARYASAAGRRDSGGRLRPGVDHLESAVPGQGRQQGANVGMAGAGHGQRQPGDPPGRGDRLLCDDPPSRASRAGHAAQHGRCVVDVQQQEAAEGEVHRLGQSQVLCRLGDGDDLGGGRRRRCTGGDVARRRVAVDRVDPPVAPHHLGEGDTHVPTAGAHVGTAPSLGQAEAVEGGGQRPPIDVVAQSQLPHRGIMACG
jgi:hypothetical protein